MTRGSLAARAVLPAVAWLAWGPASALEGDRIRPFAGASLTHTDNVYYLDSRLDPNQVGLLKNGQKSDQTLGLRAGLDVDHYYSRQVFQLRSQITDNRHRTYDALDYLAYNALGKWNWVKGERYDGDLGVELTQVATNLYDFQNLDRSTRNLRRQTSVFGSGLTKLTPDWKLRGALRYNQVDNSLTRFDAQNRQELIGEAGSRHYSKGTDDYVGLNLRYIEGRFPNREVVANSRFDNAYRQYTFESQVDYQLSGLTRVSGNFGYTKREHRELSSRDFSGITGRFSGTYALSSKTTLNGALFREIGAWEDVTSSFILTTGVSAGAVQSITDKVSLQLNASVRRRSFEGDPRNVAVQAPIRKDTFSSLSLTLTWLPTRQIRFDTSLSYDRRSANDAWAANGFGQFNNFNVLTLYGAGQVTF